MVQNGRNALSYVPKEHRTFDLCKLAVQNDGNALYHVPKKHRTFDLYKLAVQNDGNALSYVPKEHITFDLCKLAVQNDGNALRHVPKDLDKHDELVLYFKNKYLNVHFKKETRGYIVYKTFNSQYSAPKEWIIEKNSEIIENDLDRNCEKSCGRGINVATKKWVKKNYGNDQIWKCLLKFEDFDDIVVPYGTDGKIRCRKLTILEKV